jgi:choline dehydrogenase-like flavoprotein
VASVPPPDSSGPLPIGAHRPFADEDLPDGSVVDASVLTRDHEEAFDFVIIGSGASGAVAAHTLARAGFSVGIVEEGPWVKTREFDDDVFRSFGRLMRGAGLQVLEGRAYMPLLQGSCVGGSTVVNSAIAWRTPEDVLDDWRARFGVTGVGMRELEPHFDALERDLSVRSVADAVLGENNRLFVEHGRAIGAQAMRRYDRGCEGSGQCLTGCPRAKKQGMSVTYVPWALARGARIFTSCRAERVEVRGGRAVGVIAHGRPSGPERWASAARDKTRDREVRLHARLGVFVAASTVQTPNLLARSGLRARALGRHFQAHPGLAVAARMERPVGMQFGATQGAESIRFRGESRFKLETIAMPPELALARIPGLGADLAPRLADFEHVGLWAAQVRAEAEGTVRTGLGGLDRVRFTPTEADMRAARRAAATIARLFFEAGAREVWPGVYGVPAVLASPDEVRLLEDGPLDPRAYSFIASHMFGAARMGRDPETSVVDPSFATHEAASLFVIDSSIFPTNLGVNPQHSIMAMARLAATRVAERTRPLGSHLAGRAISRG